VAKNYLNEDEIDLLNRIVSMYLDFAEMQAKRRKPMYMKDWIEKLDDFLRFGEHEILTHAGKISHEEAIQKAYAEYEKYREKTKDELSPVEKHFLEAIDNTAKLIEGKRGKKR